ncbi:MAG: YdeI/OmpD-associated family protein [Kofleriaceae bacterium]
MIAKPTFFATPAAFRAWLEANHATKDELFVGLHKKSSGKASIDWSQAVDEALCFGWIDGRGQGLGPTAWMIRFTPRRPTSIWSKINVAKVAALRKAGKMAPAGEAAFAKRTDAKTGVYSFERAEVAAFTATQAMQLAANAKAHSWFTSQAPYYQRAATHWVVSAKQEATRDKRMAELIRCSAAGERIGPLTPYKTSAGPKPAKVGVSKARSKPAKVGTSPAKARAKPAKVGTSPAKARAKPTKVDVSKTAKPRARTR